MEELKAICSSWFSVTYFDSDRWDGHTVQYESAIRHDCTKGEIMALNTAMWGVIREMKGLLAPHAEDLYKPLPGDMGWIMGFALMRQRKTLQNTISGMPDCISL